MAKFDNLQKTLYNNYDGSDKTSETPPNAVTAWDMEQLVAKINELATIQKQGYDLSKNSPLKSFGLLDGEWVELVLGSPPSSSFNIDPEYQELGKNVKFVDTSLGDVRVWAWDFGDGNVSSLSNPDHIYLSSDTFTVVLTTSNDYGSKVSSKNIDVVAAIFPPVPDFSVDKTAADVSELIQFTDLSLNRPTEWLWEFGDGITSLLPSPAHVYKSKGSFDVTLTATNPNSTAETTKVDYIIISDIPIVCGDCTELNLANISMYTDEQQEVIRAGALDCCTLKDFMEVQDKVFSIPDPVFSTYSLPGVDYVRLGDDGTIESGFDITDNKFNSGTSATYIDIVNGSDSADGNTWATAYRTFANINMWSAGHGREVIYVASGTYFASDLYGPHNIYDGVSFIGVDTGGGIPTFVIGDELTWTLESGRVYTATLPEINNFINFGAILDTLSPDTSFGVPAMAKSRTSIANVESMPNSYWITGGTTIYFRPIDDRDISVDGAGIWAFRPGKSIGSANRLGDYYFENLNIYGGKGVAVNNQTPSTVSRYFFNNCEFAYVSYSSDGAFGKQVSAGVEIYLSGCTAHSSYADGFNYHASSAGGKIFEYNCTAYNCGITAVGGNNGSTTHEDIVSIRINGSYHGSGGTVINDVGTTKSWIAGGKVWNTLNLTSQAAIGAGNECKMWCDWTEIPIAENYNEFTFSVSDGTGAELTLRYSYRGYVGNTRDLGNTQGTITII